MSIPTNIADAASAIKDGTIGEQDVMIGEIMVSALTAVRITEHKEVTRRPVQAGYSVPMGVIDVPIELEMEIVLANPDSSAEGLIGAALTGSPEQLTETWKEKFDAIKALFDAKEVIDVTTHDRGFSGYIIEAIEPVYDAEEDWEGWVGTIRFVYWGSQGGETTSALDAAKTAATAAVGAF